MTQEQQEYYDDRAAIYEYCAGKSREEAERLAMKDMRDKFKEGETHG